MIPKAYLVLLLIASYNYNFRQLGKEVTKITRRRYQGKRYVDYFVVGWGARLLVTAAIATAWHYVISDLRTFPSEGCTALLLLIAVLNAACTFYEARRIHRKYLEGSCYVFDEGKENW